MTNMTDEELRQFLIDNKDRISSLLAEEVAKDMPETQEDGKDTLHQIKDVASNVNDKMKGKVSETKDKTEETFREMYSALMNPDAHRHFVKMGMEFFLGVSKILENAPVPKPVKKFQEDVAESKSQVQPEICRNNPDCLAKKKKDNDGIEKIEL